MTHTLIIRPAAAVLVVLLLIPPIPALPGAASATPLADSTLPSFQSSISAPQASRLQKDRVLIVVVDGLRPDYVTHEWMPRLNALAESGVRGLDHHAVFPTVTRVNSPALFTGRYPGGNGAMGNSVYLPEVDSTRVLDTGDLQDLRVIDEATGGRLLTTPSLGELLAEQGLVLFAAASGSTGSGAFMNPRGAGAGMVHHAVTIPDTLGPVVADVLGPLPRVWAGGPVIPLVGRAVDAVLEIGVDRADADVLAVWLTEPDGTAHEFGVGAPETVRALAGVDAEIGRLLDGLDQRGLLSSTNILVVSDHGFSMWTGEQSLDELLVEAGLKDSWESRDVVVASEAIHVMEGGDARRDEIVRLLQATEWVGPVFTADRGPDVSGAGLDADPGALAGAVRGTMPGSVPGTVGFSAVGWAHERSSDILISHDWSGEINEWGFEGEVLRRGVAGHGSSSPWDIRTAFIAAGPDIRAGLDMETPTGNIDIVPTTLRLVGAEVTSTFDGRVIEEILVDGPEPRAVPVRADSVVAETGVTDPRTSDRLRYRMVVYRSWVDSVMYFDGTRVERTPMTRMGAEEPASIGAAAAPDDAQGPDDDARGPDEAAQAADTARRFEEVRRFSSPYANQGVAVDAGHFYAITNRAIGKHDKESGELVDEWVGDPEGPIIHLNSGIVRDGLLYVAHSNYPGLPMVSSIEVWDVETMEHADSHSFGIFQGSSTWADRRDGVWWVGFANYEGWGGQPGRDPSWTTVMRFDDEWRPMGGYVFPPEVVERFEDRSNSGGAWGPDGLLYATGHDHPEVYVLRPPEAGSVLQLVETVPVTAEGQAIAWDPTEPDLLYTIVRSTSEVVVSRMVTSDR